MNYNTVTRYFLGAVLVFGPICPILGQLHAPVIGRPQPVFSVSSNLKANPLDEEIQLVTFLPDRLIPMSSPAREGENASLAKALKAFVARQSHEDISMFEAFLIEQPESRWNASILLNMGLERYETGFLSEALNYWTAAWNLALTETDLTRKAIADRAIGELLLLNARLGRVSEIKRLLFELGERPVEGAVAANVEAAKEGLLRMVSDPGVAFKCGPFALNSILNYNNNTPYERAPALEAARSTTQGTNLVMVRDWASAVGLDYQIAKKDPSAQMIVPAVMHWKTDHFAALLEQRDSRFLVQDATFGGVEMWITASAIHAETDGYYLVPSGPLPSGWRSVPDEEAATIWGKGGASTRDEDAKTCSVPRGNPTCPSPGMPSANYYLMQATANITDVPLYYQPPVGPAIAFLANYNQNETGSVAELNTHSNLGSNWDFNWLGYLEVNASYTVTIRLREGGTERYHFSLFNNVTNAFPPNVYSQAVLKWTTDANGRQVYRREMRDGSVEIYSQPGQSGTTGRFYLKHIIDPQGNKITINYEVYSKTPIIYSDPPDPGENTDPNVTSPKWTGRINEICDASGGITFIRYLSNVPTHAGFRKIKRIIDPYGRTVEFGYDGTVSQPGRVNRITDSVGMVSTFNYAVDGFIEAMTTPYGKTLFHRYSSLDLFKIIDMSDPNNPVEIVYSDRDIMRGLKITYPNGSSTVVESWIGSSVKSFHWNRLLASRYPDEPNQDPSKYLNCETYTWYLSSKSNEMSAVIRSVRRPLQSATDFYYQDGSSQTVEVGEGDDKAEITHHYSGRSNQPVASENKAANQQLFSAYNLLGNMTSFTDALGRQTRHYYAPNGVDLLEVRQVNGNMEDLLSKLHYYPNHLPSKIIDASGKETEFTFNEYGQVTSVKDALGGITTYSYIKPLGDPDAHDSLLESIDGPLAGDADTVTFTYDVAQRLRSVTDADGHTTWYEYDNLNRVLKITYQPDGVALADAESEEVVWDRLDPVLIRDRKGRLTERKYDSMGWLVSETDSEGRKIEFEWCTCGSLKKLVDGNGSVTRWDYDDLGRVTKKIRADGRPEEFRYEPNLGRLHRVTVASQVRKELSYNLDDSLARVDYWVRQVDENDVPQNDANGLPLFELDPKTPSVALVYDSVYPRLKEIRDGANNLRIGYNYHPYRAGAQSPVSLGAGALSRVDEVVLGAAILLDYDALGRLRERAIHSVVGGNLVDDNHRVVVEYDAIGRVTEMTDVLGSFEYEYDQPGKGLSRLARVGYPNGQETLYSWHPAAGHHRLSQIRHRRSNEGLLSEYGYHYGRGGQLRAWTQQVGAEALEHWVLEHDEADQLRSVVVREGGGTGTMQRQQYYSYDAGGNRTGYQEGNSVRALAYNALNQIISQPTGAPVRFEGTLDEPGTVSINNQSATLRTVLDENEAPSFRFGANLPLASGVHQVTVEARDGSGNVTEQHYEVEVGALTGQGVPEYDARGNMKSNGRGHSYEWDAANRLLAIEYADGSRTEFEYDALSRRVREVEKDAEGEVIGEKRLLWVGLGIAQERDAQNAVVKRHAGNGVALADDSKYYYTRDHLGSVRQVVDEDETVVESYSYDAYGVFVASAPGGPNGVRLADFRYTGHWHHEKSGLHLAPYRAYDAELGVWLNEDPIGEDGGINLYGYVGNGPVEVWDPLGLEVEGTFDRATGVMILTDKQKGTSVTCKVFSGNIYNGQPQHQDKPNEGPLPAGKYLIGLAYQGGHSIGGNNTWYKLYGPNGSGGYSYNGIPAGNGVFRGGFNLHVGLASDGCVTVPSDEPRGSPQYPNSPVFDQIMNLLNGTQKLNYNGSQFNGWLNVK